MNLNRPVWIEVNLDNLANNISEVRRVTPKEALVTAVIKADGYGHGAVEIGKTLLENGADRFAVATLTEALQLRKHFKEVPILVLGYTESVSIHLAIENNLIQTVYSYEQTQVFNDVAKQLKKPLKVHIKVDTGMSRLGMMSNEKSVVDIKKMTSLEFIDIEGMYTHFACADETDKTTTNKQIGKFEWLKMSLKKEGISFNIYHVSNSAAIIDMPNLPYDMVRAGIMLYGLYPSKEVSHTAVKLKEVMSLHCRVARVGLVEENVGISYGHRFITKEITKIATLPLGYADGLARNLSFKASGLVKRHGVKAPIVGTICMDQCMINVSNLEVEMGDEIIMFGEGLPIDEVAGQLETINYEIVCMMNKRIPRVYKKSGTTVQIFDNVLAL